MKLFLALIFTFTSLNVFAAENYIDALGVVQTRKAEYTVAVNSASAALTKGMAVCLDLTADDGISVDYCYAEGAKPVGVVVDASCAVGARCKLQTKGFIAFGNFDYLATATVAGGMIYAGTAGKLVAPATVTVAMFPVGVVLDAVSADSLVLEVFIDL